MTRCPIGFNGSFHEDTLDWAAWTVDMEALEDLGATAVRLNVAPWMVDDDQLDHIERCLQDARARGLDVLFVTAQLANATDDSQTLAEKTDAAVEYVEGLAARFAGYARWWQVLNEHDAMSWDTYESLGDWWDPETDTTFRRAGMTDAYLATLDEVLRRSRDAIHAVNPDCLVGTAVTGEGISETNEKYMWRPFHRVVTHVDYIGINGYPFDYAPNYPPIPARLRRTARWAGKPVLVTEIGLPLMADMDEQEGLEWIAHQIDYASRASDVQGVWCYELRDKGTDRTQPEEVFGILRQDGTRKDGWRAVRAMIRSINNTLA